MAKKSFEQSLEALERIVDELENGELTLEKALQKFDEGMALSRLCGALLDETEKKVTQLLEETQSAVPFDVRDDEDTDEAR